MIILAIYSQLAGIWFTKMFGNYYLQNLSDSSALFPSLASLVWFLCLMVYQLSWVI